MKRRYQQRKWRRRLAATTLGNDIVNVLRRALREEAFGAAEHLLCALENLAQEADDDSDEQDHRRRERDTGYLEVARNLRLTRRIT